MVDVETAHSLAERLLAEALPDRWGHTRGVAQQARTLAEQLGHDASTVEAAAWLHDIGYAPDVATTGFHPLDGARHLRDVVQADETICVLVAQHSGAAVEAEERDLSGALQAEFPLGGVSSGLLEALTACDMTVGPQGDLIDAEDRVFEILQRYEEDDPVHRAVSRSGPDLVRAAKTYFAAGPAGNL